MNRLLAQQIELLACSGDHILIARPLKSAHDGGAHHATVSGDEDFGVLVHDVLRRGGGNLG